MPRERKPFAKYQPDFILGRNRDGLRFLELRDDEQLIYLRWWAHCIEARKIFWQCSDEDLRKLSQNIHTSLRKLRRTFENLLAKGFIVKHAENGYKLRGIQDLHTGYRFEDGDDSGTDEGTNGRDNPEVRTQRLEYRGVVTRNPETQSEKETITPGGVVGEDECPGCRVPGFEEQGQVGEPARSEIEDTLPCGGFSEAQVYQSWETCLRMSGIHSVSQLANKIRHCKTSPAEWMMLLLDKLQYVYDRPAVGKDNELAGADPVALTVAGFCGNRNIPGGNAPDWSPHRPTDSARQFFVEVMTDRIVADAGAKQARWNGNLTPMAVATELKRRKGTRSKSAR